MITIIPQCKIRNYLHQVVINLRERGWIFLLVEIMRTLVMMLCTVPQERTTSKKIHISKRSNLRSNSHKKSIMSTRANILVRVLKELSILIIEDMEGFKMHLLPNSNSNPPLLIVSSPRRLRLEWVLLVITRLRVKWRENIPGFPFMRQMLVS